MSLPMVSYDSLHVVYVFTVLDAHYSNALSLDAQFACAKMCMMTRLDAWSLYRYLLLMATPVDIRHRRSRRCSSAAHRQQRAPR